MFNEQQKSAYISTLNSESSRKKFHSLFCMSEGIESEDNKDVCEWTPEDIERYFSQRRIDRTSTKQTVVGCIRSYMAWCEQQGLKTTLSEIRKYKLKTSDISSVTVANPDELQRFLDCVFQPVDMHSPDNIYRGALWLLYIGIPLEGAIRVECSDYQEDIGYIIFEGYEYPVFEQAREVLVACKYDTALITYRDTGTGDTSNPRSNSPLLLRGQRRKNDSCSLNYQVFKNKISQKENAAVACGAISKTIGFADVYMSGLFYRVYTQEQQGIPATFAEEIAKKCKTRTAAQSKKERLTEDYNAWKLAHDLL